jgi:hypothetical protein
MFKGCLVFYNLSFNFEALSLDVEACCVLTSFNIVGICGFSSRKKMISF